MGKGGKPGSAGKPGMPGMPGMPMAGIPPGIPGKPGRAPGSFGEIQRDSAQGHQWSPCGSPMVCHNDSESGVTLFKKKKT